jgi:signal transduction histidine kinase
VNTLSEWAGELRLRDVRIAVIAAGVQIAGTIGATAHNHHHGGFSCWWAASCPRPTHLGGAAFVLLAAGPAALLVRRRHPRAVLGLVFGVTLLYVSLGYQQGPCYLSLAAAFVTAALAGDRIAARATIVAGWALFPWLPAATGATGIPKLLPILAVTAWLLVILAGSEAMCGRRERVLEARRRRAEQVRRRADEERLRIARELHDVLAHNISMINVQSGVALHLIDEKPEQARIALAAINEASAEALGEVRSVLNALRGNGEQPPRAPTTGLDRLDELVANAAAGGIDVSLDITGDRRQLPATVDLAAFRIVQEALTNIVRHAGTHAARVEISYGDRDLTVQVDDDGTGQATSNGIGTGSGIAGMRERASALGGELEAGPRPSGGFRVRARLPLPSSAARA